MGNYLPFDPHFGMSQLVIPADAISYGEIVSRRRQPVTLASRLFAVAGKAEWLLTQWTWTAGRSEITSVEIVASPG